MYRNNKAQSSTNIVILIMVVLSITMVILAFKSFSTDLLLSEHANLDIQSKQYVSNELNGLNLSFDEQNISKSPFLLEDEAQSDKDYSLEFLYGKEKGGSFWSVVFDIYNAPYLFVSLFGIGNYTPAWLMAIISTMLWTLVTVGIVAFVRGVFK